MRLRKISFTIIEIEHIDIKKFLEKEAKRIFDQDFIKLCVFRKDKELLTCIIKKYMKH